MKNACAIVTALSLAASGVLGGAAFADPLAPGQPAGLHKAQDMSDNTVLYVVGLGLVAVGIAVAASGGSNGNLATGTPTTGGTTTTTTTTTTT